MLAANGIEDVDLHEIHEGEQLHVWIGHLDDRFGEAHAGVTAVMPSRNPVSDGRAWNAQIMRGLHDAIGSYFSHIRTLMQGWIPLHHIAHYIDIALRRAGSSRSLPSILYGLVCHKSLMPTQELQVATSRVIAEIFRRLDYEAFGSVYCDEGGDEFWKAKRVLCRRRGGTIAAALRPKLAVGGRSLYVGAGVPEIPCW